MKKQSSQIGQKNKNNSLVIKQSQGPLVPSQGLIFWAISCELSCKYWNPTRWKKILITAWWPACSHDVSCHSPKNWPQGNGNKLTLEQNTNCIKTIEMTLVRRLMTSFKATARADCAVYTWSPLPLPIKVLAHWLGLGRSRPLDMRPLPLAANLQNKANFSSH